VPRDNIFGGFMAIDAKQAASIAAKYYEDITKERVKLSIEEIEYMEDGHWAITLGISDPYGLGSMGSRPNAYKLFKIDAENGQVKPMKIREIKS